MDYTLRKRSMIKIILSLGSNKINKELRRYTPLHYLITVDKQNKN